MSDHSWPSWDSLTLSFRESYKAFDPTVYKTAGDIWLAALSFAKSRDCDESIAYNAMMAAIGGVSKVSGRKITSLENYLFTAFKHCLFEEMRITGRFPADSSLGDNMAIATDASVEIEKRILLEEIVAHMDSETLEVYEGLVLGYSFEELATKHGKQANVLRSRFSKQVRRIAGELNLGPVKLT
jgi:DNA-directed RNA polymerase specialized sigma24 family protein